MADLKESFGKIIDTKDTTSSFGKEDIEKNKTLSILAYLSWLVLVPLFAAKDSPFARFHCNQGIVLAIAEIVVGVALGLLGMIPYVGWVFTILGSLVGLVCLLLAVFGIVNAANGKAKELPLVGGFKLLK